MNLITLFRDYGFVLSSFFVFRKAMLRFFNFFWARLFKVRKINIHPTAKIIGIPSIKIGENFYAGKNLWIEAIHLHGDTRFTPQIIIKNNVSVNDSVHIAATKYVEIGNNVLMASNIYISDHNHGYYTGEMQSDPETPPNSRLVSCNKSVVIEDNVWLGEFVSVLPGVHIGRGCIIGSNSVVTKNIPAHSIAAGNPAIVVRQYNTTIQKWEIS